jgi:hypothetical protein
MHFAIPVKGALVPAAHGLHCLHCWAEGARRSSSLSWKVALPTGHGRH